VGGDSKSYFKAICLNRLMKGYCQVCDEEFFVPGGNYSSDESEEEEEVNELTHSDFDFDDSISSRTPEIARRRNRIAGPNPLLSL